MSATCPGLRYTFMGNLTLWHFFSQAAGQMAAAAARNEVFGAIDGEILAIQQ